MRGQVSLSLRSLWLVTLTLTLTLGREDRTGQISLSLRSLWSDLSSHPESSVVTCANKAHVRHKIEAAWWSQCESVRVNASHWEPTTACVSSRRELLGVAGSHWEPLRVVGSRWESLGAV